MIEVKDLILGAGIFATLFIGIFNASTNWRINHRTTFINTVTAERVKWLSELRKNISTFCGLTYTWQFSELEKKSEEKETEILLELDKLKYLLNPASPKNWAASPVFYYRIL